MDPVRKPPKGTTVEPMGLGLVEASTICCSEDPAKWAMT